MLELESVIALARVTEVAAARVMWEAVVQLRATVAHVAKAMLVAMQQAV